MKSLVTKLAVVLAVFAFPLAAVAQADGASPDAAAAEAPEGKKKSLSAMRREVWKFEEDFYAIYNEMNDEKEYDVRCFYETPTGSRIKNHICRANFITNAYSASAVRKRSNANRRANADDDPQIAAKKAVFEEKLQSYIGENPELQNAFVKYSTARAEFMKRANRNGS